MRVDGEVWRATAAGRRPLSMLAEQTRGVVECYDSIVRVLVAWMDSADEGVLRSGLIREAQLDFEGAQLLGAARRTEALSDKTFDNTLSFLANRDILESELIATGKRGARDTRYARGEKWSEIEGIAAVLASALRDG